MYISEETMLLFAWGFYVIVILSAALGLVRVTISGIRFTGNWFVRSIGAVIAVPSLGFVLWGIGWVMAKVGWFIASPVWSMFH